MKTMRPKRRTLILLGILSFIIYAVVATEIGPALPEIKTEMRVNEAIMGLIASLQSLAGAFAIFGGFLSDKFGKVRVTSISLWAIGLGSLMISISSSIILLGISFFTLGIGVGFFEASINAFVSDIFREKRGLAINILHVGWSVGSTVGPLLMTLMILLYGSWRLGYLVVFPIFVMLPFVLWAVTKEIFNEIDAKSELSNRSMVCRLTSTLKVLPLLFLSFLLISCNLGISTWLPTILLDQGGSLLESSLTVSMFWALVGLGRLAWAPFVDKFGYWRVLMLGGFGSSLLMVLGSLSVPIYLKILLWAVSGFFLAPTYPTVIAWVTTSYPEFGGTLSGAVYTFATLGSFSSTLLVGFIFSSFGSVAAQLIFPLIMGIVTIISYLSRNYNTSKYPIS
jgi:MFS family permease